MATVNTVFPALGVISAENTWALGSGMGVPPKATERLVPAVLAAKPAVAVGLGPLAPVGPVAPVGPLIYAQQGRSLQACEFHTS